MTNHRRNRGLATERLVADYLREWWQYATVGRGADPSGDIVNLPFDVEVKGVAKFAPLAWLRQSKARTTKSGKLGVVVLRCNGQGTLVSEYAALLPLHALVELLLRAGYDKIPLELNPIRCNKCGGWFIVVAVLPTGQISNHYELKDWDLFKIPAKDRALFEFDGHTSADVVVRLNSL